MKIKEMMKGKGFAKIAMLVGVATLWFGLVIPSAHALILLTPDTGTLGVDRWETDINGNCNLACVEGITGETGLTELYKSEFGGSDSWLLAGSYETTLDPADFLIKDADTGGPYASCPLCILEVKDGGHDPARYFFNLGSWNGQESIVGTGFWPEQGAISYVAIYGRTTSVPEPSSLLLLGSGIVSLGIIGRKFAKRKS